MADQSERERLQRDFEMELVAQRAQAEAERAEQRKAFELQVWLAARCSLLRSDLG